MFINIANIQPCIFYLEINPSLLFKISLCQYFKFTHLLLLYQAHLVSFFPLLTNQKFIAKAISSCFLFNLTKIIIIIQKIILT